MNRIMQRSNITDIRAFLQKLTPINWKKTIVPNWWSPENRFHDPNDWTPMGSLGAEKARTHFLTAITMVGSQLGKFRFLYGILVMDSKATMSVAKPLQWVKDDQMIGKIKKQMADWPKSSYDEWKQQREKMNRGLGVGFLRLKPVKMDVSKEEWLRLCPQWLRIRDGLPGSDIEHTPRGLWKGVTFPGNKNPLAMFALKPKWSWDFTKKEW